MKNITFDSLVSIDISILFKSQLDKVRLSTNLQKITQKEIMRIDDIYKALYSKLKVDFK